MIRLALVLLLFSLAVFAGDPLPQASPDWVKERMMTFASDDFEGRQAGTLRSVDAAEWIAAEFRKAGLKPPPGSNTYFQNFTAETEKGPVKTMNVVGYLPGGDPEVKTPFILFGAHWDHIGMAPAEAEGEDKVFNGADDNASGVISVIGVANNVFQGIRQNLIQKPRRGMIFIAWGAEEMGLLGSRHYVQQQPVFPIEDLSVYFNFELVGHSAKLGKRKFWLTGAQYSDFQAYLKPIVEKHQWSMVDNPFPQLQLFFRSDNFPFAAVELNREEKKMTGIPAHSFSTWGGEDHYHQVHDDPAAIDHENLASFINMMSEAAVVLANQDASVAWLKNDDFSFTRYTGVK